MSSSTQSIEYTDRLKNLGKVWWKRLVPVQAPYRWHLRSLHLGFVLDVGCGIGRNLGHINGHGVGVDHNLDSVKVSTGLGYEAYLPKDFHVSRWAQGAQFDSILFSHIVEHLNNEAAYTMIKGYLPFLKNDGRVVILCPQEAGYKSDSTHVEFMDFAALEKLCQRLNLSVQIKYSFPFPRWIGKFFKYNEFVVIANHSKSHK